MSGWAGCEEAASLQCVSLTLPTLLALMVFLMVVKRYKREECETTVIVILTTPLHLSESLNRSKYAVSNSLQKPSALGIYYHLKEAHF